MANILNKQKHEDQRMCLLSHARHLFSTHGVKETSMSQIAKALEVTKATLYHYFKSKDEILKEVLNCKGEAMDALMVKLNQANNPEECFYTLAKNHLEQMNEPENLEVMKILLSETMKNNEMRQFYMNFSEENIRLGALEILKPLAEDKKTEMELRLIFFQFSAALMHYTWHVKMVGDVSGMIGNDEAYARQLAKTYAKTLEA